MSKQLYNRIHQLEDGIQAAIDYLDDQSMLTPDEESLLEQLQRIHNDNKYY
jgi:hypothetical protein